MVSKEIWVDGKFDRNLTQEHQVLEGMRKRRKILENPPSLAPFDFLTDFIPIVGELKVILSRNATKKDKIMAGFFLIPTLKPIDFAMDSLKYLDRVADSGRALDNANDMGRALDNAGDMGRGLDKADDMGRGLDKTNDLNKSLVGANDVKKASGAKLDFSSNKFSGIEGMTKADILDGLPDGWKYTENNGFIHIRDSSGKVRMKIDPPDNVTKFDHVHLFDNNGNPIDINGNIVNRKSSDAHIPYKK